MIAVVADAVKIMALGHPLDVQDEQADATLLTRFDVSLDRHPPNLSWSGCGKRAC